MGGATVTPPPPPPPPPSGDGPVRQDALVAWYDGKDYTVTTGSSSTWRNKGTLGEDYNLFFNHIGTTTAKFLDYGFQYAPNVYHKTAKGYPQAAITNRDYTFVVVYERDKEHTVSGLVPLGGLTMGSSYYCILNTRGTPENCVYNAVVKATPSGVDIINPHDQGILIIRSDYSARKLDRFNTVGLFDAGTLGVVSLVSEMFITLGQLRTDNTVRKFKGIVYDVLLYNEALTDEEINQTLVYYRERLQI